MSNWRAWGAIALLAGGSVSCTIITTTNDRPPPPRPRRPRGRRPPPPRPTPAPTAASTARSPIVSAQLPPQPQKDDPPASPTRATVLRSGAAAGRPRGFTPGAAPAYWIWQGPRGGWRIRTTTKSAQHVFRGRVTPIGSVISSMSPSRTEFRDQVWKNGSTWMFAFKTAGHADGLTFTTRNNSCVRFDLQIDGGPVAQRIVVGKGEIAPASNHFVVCPHGKKPDVLRQR